MRVQNRFTELLAKKGRVENRRISYRTAARETGISTTSVQNWATNTVTRYDQEQIVSFCKYFNCGLSDLLILVGDDLEAGEPFYSLKKMLA